MHLVIPTHLTVTEWKYLVVLPLGGHLFPAFLLVLLFGPGFVLCEILLGKWSLVFLLQHLPSLFLPVLVLVADGLCVHCCLREIRERFPSQFRHLRQAEEGEATGQ